MRPFYIKGQNTGIVHLPLFELTAPVWLPLLVRRVQVVTNHPSEEKGMPDKHQVCGVGGWDVPQDRLRSIISVN